MKKLGIFGILLISYPTVVTETKIQIRVTTSLSCSCHKKKDKLFQGHFKFVSLHVLLLFSQ